MTEKQYFELEDSLTHQMVTLLKNHKNTSNDKLAEGPTLDWD